MQTSSSYLSFDMKIKAMLATLLLLYVGLEWTAAKSFKKMENGLSMVVRSRRSLQMQKRSLKSTMASMHIKSVVKSRFAKVKVETEMENSEDKAKEMTFSVRLPEPAFISEFTMIVDGLEFVGKVKKTELAQAEYNAARDGGNSAGLVTADVRETQTFNVAANVPARSSVTFKLVYQELLKRKLGKYEHSIFINPGQIVTDIVVSVYITEQTGITTAETRHPQRAVYDGEGTGGYDSQGEVPIDTSVRRSEDQALVIFKPTQTQQRRLLMIPEDHRKVTVMYDVTREDLGGEIQTRNDCFVHFFAPDHLPVLPKSIVFVIDTSGSMAGDKMSQTRTAFKIVLREISDADEFNIITFAEYVSVWEKNRMVKVTKDNVNRAVRHMDEIFPSGGTDLNQPLLDAGELLSNAARDDRRLSAIIVLTDGKPTHGITDELQIRRNVKKGIDDRISLFCLGFGEDLNYDFLKKLANDNSGIARKIYEDSDAYLQMEGFFREVATPLLLNIRIEYIGLNVHKVSKTNADKYFRGSEVIAVGMMQPNSTVQAQITGLNKGGKVQYRVGSNGINDDYTHWHEDAREFSNVIDRIWAYFTLKESLEKKVLAETTTEKQGYIDEALRLALKYGFVTSLTSMVVSDTRKNRVTTTAETSKTTTCCQKHVPNNMELVDIGDPYSDQGATSTSGASVLSVPLLFSELLHSFAILQAIIVSNHCGGTFTQASYTITQPNSLANHHDGTVYCDWIVELRKGSWIDLYVEEIQTSSTKVEITSERRTVYEHNSGANAFKYIPIASNRLKIRMTIDTSTTSKENIKITYNEFIPNEDTSPEVHEEQKETDSRSSVDCVMTILSSNGNSGFISSPNYPSRYLPKSRCSWNITSNDPDNLKLTLDIVDMDIETDAEHKCAYDKLVIRQADKQYKTMCGQQNGTIGVFSSTVHILFKSDDLIEGRGFKIRYDFVPL